VRIGDTSGSLDDPLQDSVERELGVDGDPGLHEHPEAVGPFPSGHRLIVSERSVVSRNRIAVLPWKDGAYPRWRLRSVALD